MQLDRGVDHMMHHMRQIHFGDRVFLPEVQALFRLVGDVQQHQPPDVELGGAFGEHELHRLTVGEQHAEGRAFCYMRDRHVERALRFCDVVHAVAQAPVGEAMLAHIESVAFAAEQVVRGNLEIPDLDFGMAAVDHVGVRAFDRHVGFGNSTMKVEYCLWRGASGSVLAMTNAMSATLADDENHFSPFRM